MKPNYELLKDAYAILAGIPARKINLYNIRKKQGPSLECGTIACGMGWLAEHPQFKALGLGLTPQYQKGDCELTLHGKTIFFSKAAAALFSIPVKHAYALFAPINAPVNHKKILLNNIMGYLSKHHQVKNTNYLW